jgi:hypothetical protein
MVWDKIRIKTELKRLHRGGANLSYNALAKKKQALVSAAAYHFGSFRRAVEAAGIDYADVIRRPRWTKQRIIQLIKAARRKGDDLHWSAVTRRRDELGRAAFASLQPRLFGRWDRALHAAGLDAGEVSRYRRWDRNSVAFELRSRQQAHEPLNSGAIQRDDSGLHAAAVRHFGSYDKALRAARVDPSAVRRRRTWTKSDVLKSLKSAHQRGAGLADSAVRRDDPALYGAAVRLFGTFTAARDATRIKWKRDIPSHSRKRKL